MPALESASTPRTPASAIPLQASPRFWFWAGLAFLGLAFAWLEGIDPYFFCQDDALVLELPGVLMALRATWQGLWPTYNPFIFLGSPTPVAAGFYPPMHVAYAVARLVLGDEHATFEVFAAMHLAAGYCLSFVVARRLGIGPRLAALAGVTFVLSGPVLVMARCWHSFSVLAAAIPLFALLVDRLRAGPPAWWWWLAMGLSLGGFYHAGFPQLFVLGCGIMLVHAASLAAVGLVPPRRLLWLMPALCLGAALSIPVFYQQWRLAQEISINDPGGGTGVERNLLALLLPYPLASGSLPNGWGNRNLQWGGHFFYFGTVLLVGFLGAVASLLRPRPTSAAGSSAENATPWRRLGPLVIPAVVALLLSLGQWGGLWWLMGLLPVGLRNNPFRALPWFVFYACLAGAAFFEALQATARTGDHPAAHNGRPRWPDAVAGLGFALVAWHLTRVGIAFYTYGFTPYPELPPELARLIAPDDAGRRQRIMSFAAMRTTDPSYAIALPHNLPCLFGTPTILGYDPLVQRFGRHIACLDRVVESPQEALAAYGVRWLVVHRTAWGGWEPQTPNRFERVFPFVALLGSALGQNPQIPLGDLSEFVRLIEIPDPAPLAFDAAAPQTPLALAMTPAGLDVELEPAAESRRVVVNFLWYPDLAATVDGRRVESTQDEWQRIVVNVPAEARRIQIRNAPPRGPGITAALLVALVGGMTLPLCRRFAA